MSRAARRVKAPHGQAMTDDGRIRIARRARWALAVVFLSLGGWCLIAPHMVEALALRPERLILNDVTAVMMGAFGAQAVLCGTLLAVCRLPALGFLIFGLVGSVPFFVFNAWFVFVDPMFSALMALDFVGNLTILGMGLVGFFVLRKAPGLSA
jgi:hypothetical protein